MTKRSLYVRAGRDAAAVRFHRGGQRDPHTLSRFCAVDLKSLCAGVAPGEGRHSCVLAVAHQRTLCGPLGKAFEGRLGGKRVPRGHPKFLPPRHYGNIASCMKPHLGEVSDPCKGALAFVASPASDR